MHMREIYLDNAATTKISKGVLDEMMPYLTDNYGNPGTSYRLGREAAKAVALARERVADLICAKPENIIFTSGGSEANSMVFNGVMDYLKRVNKKKIIVSKIEHDSVLNAAKMCMKHEFHIDYLSVNSEGVVNLDEVEKLLSNNDVGLLSLMYVNNELGTINPVKRVGEICKKHGVLFHVDCVQALNSIAVDVNDINCDFASISSHKINGAKGVGALYVNNMSDLSPLIHGGEAQEYGVRGGTPNVAGIVGFGKACDEALRRLNEGYSKIFTRKFIFFLELMGRIDDNKLKEKIKINGVQDLTSERAIGDILNVHIDGVDGETLLLMLDAEGIYMSSGAACSNLESHPSHVLLAIGKTEEEAMNSVRISFSPYTRVDEICHAARVFADCVRKILDF